MSDTILHMIDRIRDDWMWAECGHCGVRVDSELCEFDDDGEPCRELHPCSTLDGLVFCCRECRGEWMESVVSAAGRAQEQVWIAKQVFGDDITVTCLPGRWRSGFCKCDKEKCEYPGCVDIKVPGLKYWITGCMFCRRYGVARGDIESGRWAAVCERCGIVVK